MSFLVTRPPVPVPGISCISTSCSSASRRTTGEERVLRTVSGDQLSRGLCDGGFFGWGLTIRALARRHLRGRGFVLFSRYGNQQDLGPHVYRVPLGDEEFLDLPGHRRGQLGVDLVGVYLGEGFVLLDLVPFRLEPTRYRPLRNALPELGHRYRCRHNSLLLVTGQFEHRRLYLL